MPHFPLATVTETELLKLCQVLWDWSICIDCLKGRSCTVQPSRCPVHRLKKLSQFFKYYKNATATYGTFSVSSDSHFLKNHNDLIAVIAKLKERPDATRHELRETLTSPARAATSATTLADVEQAIDLAVGVLLVIDCSSTRNLFIAAELGSVPTSWRDDVSFDSFIEDAIIRTGYAYTADHEQQLAEPETRLTAHQLKKRCGLKFEATNDLRSHLVITHNTVKVFHQVAYLKENLRATKYHEQTASDAISGGMPPRQLMLEILDSIQLLLFRRSHAKSYAILRSLVSRSNFDADCLIFESASLRRPHEAENKYQYLTSRLESLGAELDDPRPTGLLETWLEEKSGARYVMMATLAGVLAAVFLGMASLAVAIYQAWLGYQQWQHPVGLAAST